MPIAVRTALGRWIAFALIAGVAYIVAYTHNLSPLDYYPMVGEVHRGEQAAELGPRITYYGWKLVGLVAGLVALLLPAAVAARIPASLAWIGPLILAGVVLFHESHWFFR